MFEASVVLALSCLAAKPIYHVVRALLHVTTLLPYSH